MSISKQTGGILLIAGTCIGAGMLALPVSLGAAGFAWSCAMLILFWAVMVLTGLYVLEVNLYLPSESNFISMAHATLGRAGEVVAWLTYLLLLYSLMAAYLSAGGGIVDNALSAATTLNLRNWVDPLPWIIIAGFFVYCGARYVDGLNRVLMLGLILTYIILVLKSVPEINTTLLGNGHSTFILAAFPILSTSFGYHVVIPSIRNYLSGDVAKLKRTIIVGSGITLVVYLFWNMVVFGTIPVDGANGLAAIFKDGNPSVEIPRALADIAHNNSLIMIAEFFVFFAIASSFIGISLALFDFLADGLNIPRTHFGRFLTLLVTFVPPLTYALAFPNGFIVALSYAGVFVAILHGLLPAAMAWAGRRNHLPKYYVAPGGKLGLIGVILFSLLIIAAQIAVNAGYLVHY